MGSAKIIALHCKLIRRYKGRFMLTKNGTRLLNAPREMFALILNALCTDFNFGYFDGYDYLPGNFTGTAAIDSLIGFRLSLANSRIPNSAPLTPSSK